MAEEWTGTWDISCEEGAAAERDTGIAGADVRVHVGMHKMPRLQDLVDGTKVSREEPPPSPGVWVLQHPHPLHLDQTPVCPGPPLPTSFYSLPDQRAVLGFKRMLQSPNPLFNFFLIFFFLIVSPVSLLQVRSRCDKQLQRAPPH